MALFFEELERKQGPVRERSMAPFYEELERTALLDEEQEPGNAPWRKSTTRKEATLRGAIL